MLAKSSLIIHEKIKLHVGSEHALALDCAIHPLRFLMADVQDQEAFKLSCEILGHTGDVRAVKVQGSGGNKKIFTASRDGTACVWSTDTRNKEFVLSKRITSHTGYVSSLCVIDASDSTGRKKCKHYREAAKFGTLAFVERVKMTMNLIVSHG